MIAFREWFGKADTVKRAIRTKLFAKRDVNIKEAGLVIDGGRHFRRGATFKIHGAGKLFSGLTGNDMINQSLFHILYRIKNRRYSV